MTNFDDFINLCRREWEVHQDWRWGQTVFNTLHNVNPMLANRVRATRLDPFYKDVHEMTEFMEWLEKQLDEG